MADRGSRLPRVAAIVGHADEADLLAHWIRHHLAIGIDHIFVSVNQEDPSTSEVLSRFGSDPRLRAAEVHSFARDPFDYFSAAVDLVSDWCTPDWILFSDTDEFWIPAATRFAEVTGLRGEGVLVVERYNMPLLREPGGTLPIASLANLAALPIITAPQDLREKYLLGCDDVPLIMERLQPKILARVDIIGRIGPGGHRVFARDPEVCRTLASDLIILHAPFTTQDRFLKKLKQIRNVFAEYGGRFHGARAWHWKYWLDLPEERLTAEYLRQSIDSRAVPELMAKGVLSTPAAHLRSARQDHLRSSAAQVRTRLAQAVGYEGRSPGRAGRSAPAEPSQTDQNQTASGSVPAAALSASTPALRPISLPTRAAIVIIGMHRSGTSALSRAVSCCGCAQPRDLMAPSQSNPGGFWESLGVVGLNNRILSALGGSWRRPGPFLVADQDLAASRDRIMSFVIEHWTEEAVSALRRAYGDAPLIVLNDPRITVLLPFWAHALATAGYGARPVIIYRHPLEVARSLQVRDQMKLRHALELWTLYNLAALTGTAAPGFIVVVGYENLLADPVAVVAPIMQRITSAFRGVHDVDLAGMRSSISAAERHHVSSTAALSQRPQVAAIVKDLWQLLLTWNSSDTGDRNGRLAALRQIYDEAMLLAGSILRSPDLVELAKQISRESSGPVVGVPSPPWRSAPSLAMSDRPEAVSGEKPSPTSSGL